MTEEPFLLSFSLNQDDGCFADEGVKEDRISGLPKNVLDSILERLPIQDAARTCVLSKSWRYIWHMLPGLVLAWHVNKGRKFGDNFSGVVDDILLSHRKKIVKFVLEVNRLEPPSRSLSGYRISSFTDVDRWLLFVTRKGVKELTLNLSCADRDSYYLPSCIFHCETLTHLKLTDSIFKPPTYFLGFRNLITLDLLGITFEPVLEFITIKAPLLANLCISLCWGTEFLKIVSSGLKTLDISDIHCYLLLNCFMNCKDLRVLKLMNVVVNDSTIHHQRSTLVNFLASLPALEELFLGPFIIELLSAVVVPNGLPFTFNCLWRLSLVLDFGKLDQTSCTLQLIKCLPNLSNLVIFYVTDDAKDDEAVLKCLDTLACLERPLDKLKHVAIRFFRGSKTELSFVKLLFSHATTLVTMFIDIMDRVFDASRQRDILREMARFPRASPRAELVYYSSLLSVVKM